MARFLSMAKLTVGLVGIAAAIVGWGVVVLQAQWLDDLEGKLADSDQELAVAAQEQSQVSQEQAPVQDAARDYEEVQRQAMTSLEQLRAELDAGEERLASLRSQIEASTAELDRLEAEIEEKGTERVDPGLEYRTTTRARVRTGPTTDANEVAVVAADQLVEVSGSSESETWYKVTVSGYMFHRLLRPSPGQ